MPRKVALITGGAGFIGCNLARDLLARENYEVHLFVKSSTDLWRLGELESRLQIHQCDLALDRDCVARVLRIAPEIVFHLASFGGHPTDLEARGHALSNNTVGTLQLLEAVRLARPRAYLHLGSALEYGASDSPRVEHQALNPYSFRGSVKAAETLLSLQYATEYGLPIRIARTTNVFGPFEQPARLIPALIKKIHRGEKIQLTSQPTVRDFIFVRDLVRGLIDFAEHAGLDGQVINFASGRQYSNFEVLDLLHGIMGRRSQFSESLHPGSVADCSNYRLSIAKAEESLYWRPELSLFEGLELTVKWLVTEGVAFGKYT